ncbi:maltase [Filobasidium floriforme]|uniref:maltase n=1 Tax=Filobasidium floriforme TaxID=5210 RepID=UPI001E8DE055|nr:maltase [Filobasidium floriforme]KAH8083737.1 maltase [Filobasidium floriforme]
MSSDEPVPKHERKWWKEAVFYQIYPASFRETPPKGVSPDSYAYQGIGNFEGIISSLDYLQHDLGVDAIWVSPHYESPERDMGYDISNYQNVNSKYGTLEDCDRLIKETHARGMKIVFDLVINHCSTDHAWFQEARSSVNNPKRDYFIWRPPKGFDEQGRPIPPNNWAAAFGGSVWEWDEGTQEYYLHLFDKTQADFNWENKECRQAIYDEAIRFWLDRGIDGFRIDTVVLYSKHLDFPDAPVTNPSVEWQRPDDLVGFGPRLLEFVSEMVSESMSGYGDIVTIGEAAVPGGGERLRSLVSARENRLSMLFLFDIALLDAGRDHAHFARPWSLPEWKQHVVEYQRVMDGGDCWNTNYLENHDRGRSVTRYASDAPEHRVASGKLLALYLLTQSGTPFIYQGEELGIINAPLTYPIEDYMDTESINWWAWINQTYKDDPATIQRAREGLQLNARDHARMPMQWTGGANGGFTGAKASPWQKMNPCYTSINVETQLNDPASVLSFYKQLVAIRKRHPDLFSYGRFTMLDEHDDETMIWIKDTEEETGEQALVVLNFTPRRLEFKMPRARMKGNPELTMSTHEGSDEDVLEPFEGRLYFCNA